jgi:translation initiation factor IF-1
MLPTQLFTAVQQLSLNQKPLVTGVTDVRPVDVHFEIGQKMQGQVQAQISQGVFKVQVADQAVQMALPRNIRSGDRVDLEVLSIQPKLTFGLVASNNPLSTAEQLSTAARLFSSMTQQQAEHAVVRAPQGQALWMANQPPETTALAKNLQQAISQSGLFYESHQVQWLEGGRSTTQLLQEPQNQPHAPVTSAETMQRPVLPAEVPPHLHHLVQQQLNALDSGQIVWHGLAWPDQEMEWEIHEEAKQPEQSSEERQWATQLHLNLPLLGGVSASLRLVGSNLSLHLDAESEHTFQLFQRHSPTLVAALTQHGISVPHTQVTRHDHGG